MAHLELNRGYWNLVEQLPGGRRRRRSLQTTDYAQAVKQAVLEYDAQLNSDNLVVVFWKTYRYLRESLKPPTLANYTEAWSNFQKFLTPQRNIQTVTSDDLIRWKEQLSRSVNQTTVAIRMRAVKAIWGKMLQLGLVEHNPWKDLKRFIPQPLKRNEYLSSDEIQRLLDAAAEVPLHQLYIRLLLQTGLRQNELYNLKWSDIKDAYIVIQGKGGVRKFPRWRSVDETLKAIHKFNQQNEYVYVNARNRKHPYSRNEIGKMVKRYIRKAGLRESLTIHCLRHTFATQLVKKGIDIRKLQHLMGHQQITTTMRYEHGNVLDIPEQTYF